MVIANGMNMGLFLKVTDGTTSGSFMKYQLSRLQSSHIQGKDVERVFHTHAHVHKKIEKTLKCMIHRNSVS